MTATAKAPPRARGSIQLMFDRTFGMLFWGKMFAVIGAWTHSLVAAVVVHQATHSALLVGLVGVAQFGPQLILSPVSGKWADLGDPARQIMLGRVLCVIASGSIALWLARAPGATGVYVTGGVMAGSLLAGIGMVIGGPAMQSIVPRLIRPGELPTAMALNTVPMTVGRMAGPAVGAILVTQFGHPAAFAVSGVLNIIFIVMLLGARFPAAPERSAHHDYRVSAALRYVWQDHPLRLALAAVAVVGFASDPSITLAPSMAAHLGGGTHLVGALSAAFGIGAAAALALLASLGSRASAEWTSSVGLWLLAAGSALLAAAAVSGVALAGFALAGFGFGAAVTGLSTVVQERAPEKLRGRIMALWLVGFLGSRPLAAVVLGGSADALSVRAAFLISSALIVVAALCCRPRGLTGADRFPSAELLRSDSIPARG